MIIITTALYCGRKDNEVYKHRCFIAKGRPMDSGIMCHDAGAFGMSSTQNNEK